MTRSRANIRSKAQHGRTQTRAPKQLQLRIIMAEITPPIWRLVRVPDRFTLHQLHRVLQIVFSRLDYHLYAFRMGSRSFEAPDPESEAEDATAIVLNSLGLLPGSQFTYIYDFGDGWEHSIAVEALLPMPSENGPDWSPRLPTSASRMMVARRPPPSRDTLRQSLVAGICWRQPSGPTQNSRRTS